MGTALKSAAGALGGNCCRTNSQLLKISSKGGSDFFPGNVWYKLEIWEKLI
jgi:hypothetical protein